MSGLLVGVDGGGSKTAYALCDLSGAVLARFEGDTTNYNQVGFDGVTTAISEGLAALRRSAGLAADACVDGAVLGLGGVGEISAEMGSLLRAVKTALGATPHRLVNDSEVGWAGALALAPGINIIAGTGSLAFGINANGETARAGGWAWAIGDEGSAHWLARRILNIFTRQSDGRLPRTALYHCLRERLNVTEDVDVRFLPMQAPRKEVAALATILPLAEALGDETPGELYREAAEELALTVRGIRSQISFDDPVDVSATGGVFRLSPLILQTFIAALPRYGARYAAPQVAPVEGALLMAARDFSPAALEVIRNRLLAGHPFEQQPIEKVSVNAA